MVFNQNSVKTKKLYISLFFAFEALSSVSRHFWFNQLAIGQNFSIILDLKLLNWVEQELLNWVNPNF